VRTTLQIVALIGSPLGLFAILLMSPRLDVFFQSATFHVFVVGGIAACATFVALVAWISAIRERNSSVLLVALGCLGLAMLMLAHGLTTPTVLGQPGNVWIGRLPVLGIGTFAVFVSLAALQRRRIDDFIARIPWWATILPVLAPATVAVVVVLDPWVGHGRVPTPIEGPLTTILTTMAALLLVPAGAVYWRRWRFGRDPVQFALAAAAWYSTCALVAMELGRPWRLSWWDYHVYLLAGFGAATWAVARETRRTRDPVTAMTRLAVVDPVEQIARGYTESLRPLVAAVEAKDYYTHGHSERVSTLAARLALRMRLTPETVRAVAEGAYLHDIGKIAVPDAILNKPGDLNTEERRIVEVHPVTGWEIASRAPSLRHTHSAIRHHHERWDGTGYPDGLQTADIPLAARVVAVADVWDALTSDRSYRSAWTPEDTAAFVLSERGRHFDPDCVDALLAMLGEDGSIARSLRNALLHPADSDVCHHRRPETPRLDIRMDTERVRAQ
jgi:HD-GYP domain-containing protein (c-di-GMP phosphodiesterase class II)